MAAYSIWAKTRKTPRVAWVCGPEAVLRRDVADAYRAAYPRLPVFSLQARHEDTWDLLLTVPPAPRLLFVQGAQELQARDRIRHLLEGEFDGAFTVFLSAENDFPRVTADRGQDRPGSVLAPEFAALRDSRHGLLVRCSAPRDPEAQAALVASWWPGAGRNVGAAVLEGCGGDLAAARSAVRKATCAGLPPTAAAVTAVTLPGAHGEFADHLVACDIKQALGAAAQVDPEEAGMALGLLSFRLTLLAVIGDAVRRGEHVSEFARRQKIDMFLVQKLRQHAAAYTPEKVSRCRQLLAMAEANWRAGARDGILEAVAALW